MRKLSMTLLCACLMATAARSAYGDKHDKWVEARSQNFIVVSNAGEKQARKTDVQFEQIRALFREYLMIAKDHPSPVITIIAAKDENSMREFMPEFWAKGHAHPAGVFFRSLDQQEIIVQADADGTNPYATIYHEYYHSLTMPYLPGLPVWLAEGQADFFGYSHVEGQKAYMGEPAPGLIWELRQNQMIPLDVLFAVNRTSPYYNEANKTNIFYAESWALTHYLWLADKGGHKQMLAAYLMAATQPGATEEQAVKAFGDLKKLQAALQRYVGNERFADFEAAAPPIQATDITVRELSDAEADAYLGGFEAVRAKPERAKPLLLEAIKLDPNVALAYQNLGVAEFLEGDRKAAFESFSKAVSIDPKSAPAHYFRAYLGLGREGGAAGDAQFDDDLRQAIALDPNSSPPYELLARHLAGSSENLAEALSVAKQAVKLEPGNSGALLTLAHVLIQMKDFNDAQTVAQWAERDALNAPQRESAEQILNYVQQVRNLGVANGPAPATNSTARAAGAGSDDTDEPEKPNSKGLRHAIGPVTQSSCVNGVPQIEIKTDSGVVLLHGAPDGKLDINVSFEPAAGLDACTLKGYRVAASYISDDTSGTRGTVTTIRVLRPASDSNE